MFSAILKCSKKAKVLEKITSIYALLLLLLLSHFSRVRLCDPRDGSPPGSPIPGILQARTLEWLPSPSPMHESEKRK